MDEAIEVLDLCYKILGDGIEELKQATDKTPSLVKISTTCRSIINLVESLAAMVPYIEQAESEPSEENQTP